MPWLKPAAGRRGNGDARASRLLEKGGKVRIVSNVSTPTISDWVNYLVISQFAYSSYFTSRATFRECVLQYREDTESLLVQYHQRVMLLRHAKKRLPADRSRFTLCQDVEISALEARASRLRDRMRQLARAD